MLSYEVMLHWLVFFIKFKFSQSSTVYRIYEVSRMAVYLQCSWVTHVYPGVVLQVKAGAVQHELGEYGGDPNNLINVNI